MGPLSKAALSEAWGLSSLVVSVALDSSAVWMACPLLELFPAGAVSRLPRWHGLSAVAMAGAVMAADPCHDASFFPDSRRPGFPRSCSAASGGPWHCGFDGIL